MDLARAVELAREATGADREVPADAVVVHRPDRTDDYALVTIGRAGESGWVAAVDPAGGEVMSWAENPSGEPTVPPLTGPADGYVWAPGVRSRSPLYPLLRTSGPDGEHYVDLAGRVPDPWPRGRG